VNFVCLAPAILITVTLRCGGLGGRALFERLLGVDPVIPVARGPAPGGDHRA